MAGIMATKSPPKPFRQQAVICEPRVDGGRAPTTVLQHPRNQPGKMLRRSSPALIAISGAERPQTPLPRWSRPPSRIAP